MPQIGYLQIIGYNLFVRPHALNRLFTIYVNYNQR